MSSNLHIFTEKNQNSRRLEPSPLRGGPSPLPCSLSVPRSLSMTRRSERRAARRTLPVPSPNGKPHPERAAGRCIFRKVELCTIFKIRSQKQNRLSIIKLRVPKPRLWKSAPSSSLSATLSLCPKGQSSHARSAPPLPKNLASLRFSGTLLPHTCGF